MPPITPHLSSVPDPLGTHRSILLVDDDPAVRTLLGEILTDRNYVVYEASSGEQALAMMDDRTIDGFLLDVSLGGMDGIELCRHIRSRDRYKVSPIIFLTGEHEGAYLERAFEAGGDDFISKPFDSTLVEARLKGHFERAKYFLELKKTRELLSRYVSDATSRVIESTLSTGKPLQAEARDVSICFTDIRGFTALSEKLDPFTLFSALSQHLSDQVRQVHDFGGYIDKFSGDGLMAIFEGSDKEVRSCLCALGLLEHARAQDDPETRRIQQLGIGIHTGRAVIGKLGSDLRLDYTAVGSAVNLAARLCGAAEPLSVVVSGSVRDAAKDGRRLRFHSGREVTLRGLDKPVTIFSLSRGDESRSAPSGAGNPLSGR